MMPCSSRAARNFWSVVSPLAIGAAASRAADAAPNMASGRATMCYGLPEVGGHAETESGGQDRRVDCYASILPHRAMAFSDYRVVVTGVMTRRHLRGRSRSRAVSLSAGHNAYPSDQGLS